MTEVHCYLLENPIAPWANIVLEGLWWRCEEQTPTGAHGYWVKAYE